MKDRDFNLAQRKWDNIAPTEPLILCLGCKKPVLWNDSENGMCRECAENEKEDESCSVNS